jgi:L-rhamnose isomerase
MYGEFGGRAVDRNAIEPAHFAGWIAWAKSKKYGLDFNATCFSHPKAADGFTLSNADPAIRAFWVEHVRRCRTIGAEMGRELGSACVHNLWIPDGSKDHPADRFQRRVWLKESLDAIYADRQDAKLLVDAIEGKLFGIGSEAFVVGSHEFYLAYALQHGLLPTLDLGHYHPTESVADKISAVLQFSPRVLLHLSRGVRWDSDHVVVLNDEIRAVMEEVVRAHALDRVVLALDYFDASLNRVGAWVTGARAVQQGLLLALLEPAARVRECEAAGDMFSRLALLETAKSMPFGSVWDRYCANAGVPASQGWITAIRAYEQEVLGRRR